MPKALDGNQVGVEAIKSTATASATGPARIHRLSLRLKCVRSRISGNLTIFFHFANTVGAPVAP